MILRAVLLGSNLPDLCEFRSLSLALALSFALALSLALAIRLLPALTVSVRVPLNDPEDLLLLVLDLQLK